MRTHTKEKPYECNMCDKKFARTGDLREHKLQHGNFVGHYCHFCDKVFKLKRSLSVHIKKKHRGECDPLATVVIKTEEEMDNIGVL